LAELEDDSVDEIDDAEPVRVAFCLSLQKESQHQGYSRRAEKFAVLLSGPVEDGTLPLGVACFYLELEALLLDSGPEASVFGCGRHCARWCVGTLEVSGRIDCRRALLLLEVNKDTVRFEK
jgi:hypothetical protein